ncbi:carbohydrate kinase family protein [Paenibacillus contaminans]|uniref:Carbohydrate kinase family protein n=1 Tax=Paenibacillus contaminans TaxID=450362 RepID=A0A329MRH7_9BACL|nr:carbohydrate kinase family protein [Paenibacillus contaminans]RAV22394.1 carbohydrate kinase family protein [Paenibacillus contaminans]
MNGQSADIVVAGHICLDVIPAVPGHSGGVGAMLVPGKLTEIGPALLSVGGAVANTGLALHRLGFSVRLMGKVGDDRFGQTILEELSGYAGRLTETMIVAQGEHSSYTIVISPPGVDRIFLHATGANDTFCAADVRLETLEGARLFHFGYPPLMRGMYERDGEELVRLLAGVKSKGLTVSLDLAKPDPDSAAGRADWQAILARSLPNVDVFLPSFEEILYMLRPGLYDRLMRQHGAENMLAVADGPLLSSLAEELLGMGAAVVGLKLGEYGLYVRSTSDGKRLAAMGACAPAAADWAGRELLVPCFKVKAVGTTGAGDCTIAGFIGGLTQGLSIEQTLLGAVGVGACNVEQADAVSGVPGWNDVLERMAAGWEQSGAALSLPGWSVTDGNGSRIYRNDGRG